MKIDRFKANPVQLLVAILVLGIIAWGLSAPNGLRAAAADNAWSIAYLKYHFDNSVTFPQLYMPPSTHANASVLLAYQAMNQGDFNLASQYVNRLVDSAHPFALNTYAQLQYLQGDYGGAFELWKTVGNIPRLEQAAGEFQENGKKELAIQAFQSLYEIQPEIYTGILANKLSENQDIPAAIAVLKQAIHDYPDSTQKSYLAAFFGR